MVVNLGLNLFANDPQMITISGPTDMAANGNRGKERAIDVDWAADQLERLGRLHDQGIIDADEYRQLKTKVLANFS